MEESGTAAVLSGVLAVGEEVWAVGDRGTVLRRQGAWGPVELPAGGEKVALCAISGRSAKDIWIVGARRSTLRWDGEALTWLYQEGPGTEARCLAQAASGDRNFYDVWAGPDAVWATGDGGSLWRWQTSKGAEGGWVQVRGRGGSTVWGSGSNDIWAGGPGVLDHWDGFQATSHLSRFEDSLAAVYGVPGPAGLDVWAVGARGGSLRSRGGGTWERIPTGVAVPLHDVWGSAEDDVWAVGEEGTVLRHGKAGWERVQLDTAHREAAFYAVWGTGRGEVCLGGERRHASAEGLLLCGSAGALTEVALPPGMEAIFGIWGVAGGDLWLVGGASKGWAYRRPQGGAFESVLSGVTGRLSGVSGSGKGDVWMVGGVGQLWRWDGKGVTAYPALGIDGVQRPVLGVDVLPDGRAWAVGGSGMILSFDGKAWSAVRSGSGNILVGVFAQKDGQAWAVGPLPSILYHPRSR